MHYGSIGMHDRLSEREQIQVAGSISWWSHLSVIMGTANFWWAIKVPYHKLSVSLIFAAWARNSLY